MFRITQLTFMTIGTLVLAGCQTQQSRTEIGPTVVAPTVSLEDERQSKCGHIPDDRPNAVRRIDCRNAVLIAYKEQNDPGNLDIAHEYARAYKKAATDYRNGRIGQEQYTLRSEQARDAALKAEAERNEERRLAALAAPSVNQMNQTVWGSPH